MRETPWGAELPFRRLLMLQGPAGPFFRMLARHLGDRRVEAWKINLNAGDAAYFFGSNTLSFRGRPEAWPSYLSGVLTRKQIDAVALFGEERFYHREAIKLARNAGIPVFVFEEGYIRPDYVTVELGGVNGHSGLLKRNNEPADRTSRGQQQMRDPAHAAPVGNSFPALVWHCMVYWSAMDLGRPLFPHYRHHKPGSLAEIQPWLLSVWRKIRYGRRDRAAVDRLLAHDTPYFVVPLQVHRDSQIMRDSGFLSVGHFIVTVMESFAACAPVDHMLLFKQHPLDRGFTDYTALVTYTADRLGCTERIMYIRDAHLPTLLGKASGTVTVNSTVGLSSLMHGTPVKALGRAIYDRPGLAAQCTLREFWTMPGHVDAARVSNFVTGLTETCQANGSFYRRWSATDIMASVTALMARQYVLGLEAATAKDRLRRPHSSSRATGPVGKTPRRQRPHDTVH